MSSQRSAQLLGTSQRICRHCRQRKTQFLSSNSPLTHRRSPFSTSTTRHDELDAIFDSPEAPISSSPSAAPPIDFSTFKPIRPGQPARIIPSSPSYFTARPQATDTMLHLKSLLHEYGHLPTIPTSTLRSKADTALVKYHEFGSILASPEAVPVSKFKRIIAIVARLNRIEPRLRSSKLRETLDRYRSPNAGSFAKPAKSVIDAEGRAAAVGRRKEAVAKVFLVEGEGEVLVNGRSIIQAFPRLHDRESALWALKVTGRLDRYNVFVLTHGGGLTGQAESVTLAVARALIAHEPALKPLLRKAGCVTRDPRSVERKKPGKLKARKSPAWVKR